MWNPTEIKDFNLKVTIAGQTTTFPFLKCTYESLLSEVIWNEYVASFSEETNNNISLDLCLWRYENEMFAKTLILLSYWNWKRIEEFDLESLKESIRFEKNQEINENIKNHLIIPLDSTIKELVTGWYLSFDDESKIYSLSDKFKKMLFVPKEIIK